MAETNGRQQINPVAAGLTGAIIGAGIAMIATKVMSDQKTRERIMDMAAGVREKANMMLRGRNGAERVSHEISRGRGRKSSRRGRTMNKLMAGAKGARRAMSM